MDEWFKRLIEWYLSVPPTGPGQGTSWTFRLRSPWPDDIPAWGLVLLVPLLVAAIGAAYWRDVQRLSMSQRALLTALRFSAILLVLWLLTETSLSVDRTGLPYLGVMIDTSASMGLESGTGVDDSPGSDRNRLQHVQEELAGESSDLLEELYARYQVRLFEFSADARPLAVDAVGDELDIDAVKRAIRRLEPNGMETAPAAALEQVLRDLRGLSPVGVIIFTDGVATSADHGELSRAAPLAREQATQLFPVGAGSERPMRDLQIAEVLMDEVAFVGDPVRIAVRVRASELDGHLSRVDVRETGESAPLATHDYRVGQDGRIELELSYIPEAAGEFDLVIETPVVEGEIDRENNRQFRRLSVRDEKTRVLFVEGFPRYEYRALKHLLERQPTVELDTVLQDADIAFAEQDRTALERMPTSTEELGAYDVIILGDVDPQLLSPAVLERLQDFVRTQGGGLVMIAGTEHNPWSYGGTPLEPLLPFDSAADLAPLASASDGFQPALTVHGRKGTGIFRFGESEEISAAIWNELAPLYWYVPLERVKPGTTVYVEHPYRQGESGRLPLITLSRYGGGKILFQATDETWRWRFRVGDTYYAHYWVQALRYLSRSRLIGRERAAELVTDRAVYEAGDTVRFRLRFLDERFLPADGRATIVVEPRGGSVQEVALEPLPELPQVFEGLLPRVTAGSYHAWVSKPNFEDGPPAADFRVEIPQRELKVHELNKSDLLQAAKVSRGAYLDVHNSSRLPGLIPEGNPIPLKTAEPIPLWSRWEPWLVVILLLSTEWWLRNRWWLL